LLKDSLLWDKVRLRWLPRGVLPVADACALALFTMIGAREGAALEFAGNSVKPPISLDLPVGD
jgi:uncharacterized membrane protein YeiH